MGHTETANPFAQHYLELQALSPVEDVNPPSTITKTNTGILLTFPVILIILLFIGVFGWQLYTRIKYLNRILMILGFGLIVGSIPLTVNMLNSRSTEMATKAKYDFTPQTIIVDAVTTTGFTVSWKTKVPTLGAVKISTLITMNQDVMVLREAKANLSHTFTLTGLKPGTTYFFELYSDVWYHYQGQPISITTQK